jgi:hypothetical protein
LASFEGFDTSRIPAPASSRLIADGDSVARNAFRVGLREDTPLPIASLADRAGITQELDPGDILEVQDMAAAIARAEMLVLRTPIPPAKASASSEPDMFEALGQRATRATDDASGPATPAPPYVATPVPPAPTSPRYVTMPSAPIVPAIASPALPAIPPSPAPPTALEDDAFYHPLGRMRSLADVTLDGYRPEPTLLVRAASRRKRFSWVLLAALVPLVVLAGIAVAASSPLDPAVRSRASAAVTSEKTPLASTSVHVRAKSSAVGEAKQPAGTPVFDVNSLPPAARAGIRARR